MAYIALYRKFRPKTFDEIVGQGHIEKTLKNQLISNHINLKYIYSFKVKISSSYKFSVPSAPIPIKFEPLSFHSTFTISHK